MNIFQEKGREGKKDSKDDSEIIKAAHSCHRPSAQALGKGRTKVPPLWFQRRGPLPPHTAPVWLGPLQKALALPSPRGGVNQMNWEGDFCTLVGLEIKALNQEGLFLQHHS